MGIVLRAVLSGWTGVCFRPLTGMVSSTTLQARASSCFRPLTGIVLYDYQIKGFFKEFSPPYGDGIKWAMQNQTYSVFSPPYGDGISEKVTNVLTLAVFAPLRGLYPKYITKHRKTEEPDG